MSFERVRTTSHKSSHKNLGIINYNNFISPKNTLNNNMKNRNNAKSHTNLMSPINMENNGKLWLKEISLASLNQGDRTTPLQGLYNSGHARG